MGGEVFSSLGVVLYIIEEITEYHIETVYSLGAKHG